MRLSHTRDLVVDDDLSFMAAPTCNYTAVQLGRTANLEAGAGVLMTNAEIGSMQLAAASRFITFRVPRKPIEALLPDPDAAVARRIPADNAALKLLVSYLDNARDTRALTTINKRCSSSRSPTFMIFWHWHSAPPGETRRLPIAGACAPRAYAPQGLYRTLQRSA